LGVRAQCAPLICVSDQTLRVLAGKLLKVTGLSR